MTKLRSLLGNPKFQRLLAVLGVALVLLGGLALPMGAAPEFTGFTFVHLTGYTATATPMLRVANNPNDATAGVAVEIAPAGTAAYRCGKTSVCGSMEPAVFSIASTLVTQTATITPVRNVMPLTTLAAVTVANIVTTNWHSGAELVIYNTVATATVISETPTISLAGNATLGLGDSMRLTYSAALGSWVEISRSNN